MLLQLIVKRQVQIALGQLTPTMPPFSAIAQAFIISRNRKQEDSHLLPKICKCVL